MTASADKFTRQDLRAIRVWSPSLTRRPGQVAVENYG